MRIWRRPGLAKETRGIHGVGFMRAHSHFTFLERICSFACGGVRKSAVQVTQGGYAKNVNFV